MRPPLATAEIPAYLSGRILQHEQEATVETQRAPGANDSALDKILAALPIATYRAGDVVLAAGSKTGQLLILKKGAVAILKGSVEIARVNEPGAVIGELSALLDQPHSADVKALEDSQFRVADAALLDKDPIAVLHIARILAQRLVAIDNGFVELKKQIQAGQAPGVLGRTLEKIEKALAAWSADAPPLSPGWRGDVERPI
jgi:CRP/FNR family transcriptional regulator, cyclic AMP receptor protein